MKIKIQTIITFLAFAAASGFPQLAQAQQSTQAIMEVNASVIKGVLSDIPGHTDLTNQISVEIQEFSLGEYGISLPMGTDYLIYNEPDITMRDKNTTWTIYSAMIQQTETDGTINLSFKGIPSANGLEPGQYSGQQTIRIEYY
jgi:hypothetical protein